MAPGDASTFRGKVNVVKGAATKTFTVAGENFSRFSKQATPDGFYYWMIPATAMRGIIGGHAGTNRREKGRACSIGEMHGVAIASRPL